MTTEQATAVVHAFERAYEDAFNSGDARRLAKLLLEDATLMSEWGDAGSTSERIVV